MCKKKNKTTKNSSTSQNNGLHVKGYTNVVSERWSSLKRSFNNNFNRLLDYKVNHVSSFEKFTRFLYRPTDPASLGVARALFGLCMVIDVVDERGLANIDIKWGNSWECHFPLIHGMRSLSLQWMIMIYAVMWMGAFGIMLGLHFKIACACFVLPYWYIFLLDKSYWNNHTYLYGIVATLFWGTEANKYLALEASNAKRNGDTVPYWNYFILKFQFFILYFLAGLKKSDIEWLEGYGLMNLSKHWIFHPFKIFLTTEQIDFLIIHWFAFIFDLSVGFWMLFEKTRIPAMIFCATFHFMNSRLFSIGMFPYVCLATMPLFCRVDWPRRFGLYFNWKQKSLAVDSDNSIDANDVKEAEDDQIEKFDHSASLSDETLSNETTQEDKSAKEKIDQDHFIKSEFKEKSEEEEEEEERDNNIQSRNSAENSIKSIEKEAASVRKKIHQAPKITRKQKFVVCLLLCHMVLQFFLPYSHFISKGYNNWVPGLYGYSWDMMIHEWNTILVVVKVYDNVNDEVRYLNPGAWVQGDRWTRHGDMAVQYSQCLKDNLIRRKREASSINYQSEDKEEWMRLSTNLSIYLDVWCSLNSRFQQRIFNPNVDMLTVNWHPFEPLSFLMPLLVQYNSYRQMMEEIEDHIFTWSNYTDVLFVADFPGMHLENYMSTDFVNVSLTVLEGEVTYNDEKSFDEIIVSKRNSISVKTGIFHRVRTTSPYPACYMYTYTNRTKQKLEKKGTIPTVVIKDKPLLLQEINHKISLWTKAFNHIENAFLHLVHNVPMIQRTCTNVH